MEKKCWAAAAFCHLDPSEQDVGPPEALIPHDEECSEEDRSFFPRFLLQAVILAHSPYGGVFPSISRLQGDLLCRSDWLCLRGISQTECMILPVRELAAFSWCSVCEQHKAQERSGSVGRELHRQAEGDHHRVSRQALEEAQQLTSPERNG